MTTDAIGGVWNYSISLAKALGKFKVDVLLAVMGPPPSLDQREEALKVPNLEVVYGDFPLEWLQAFSTTDLDASGEWLKRLANGFKPDIIQLSSYSHAALTWNAPTVLVAHSCVYSWWRSVHHCAPPLRTHSAYRKLVVAGLKSASAVVAPSRWMLKALSRHYKVPFACASVIPNFSGLEIEVASKEPFIFASGRLWDAAKNLQLLEQIAGDLAWPLIAAGDLQGPEGKWSGNGTMHLPGHLSTRQVSQHLARASVFAHPAKYEPFGLAILEAARSGCALVLADIPSLRELWSGAALFAPPDEPEKWKQLLNRLAGSGAERERLSRAAVLRSQRFTAAASALHYFRLYERLCHSDDHRTSLAGDWTLHEPSDQTILSFDRL